MSLSVFLGVVELYPIVLTITISFQEVLFGALQLIGACNAVGSWTSVVISSYPGHQYIRLKSIHDAKMVDE